MSIDAVTTSQLIPLLDKLLEQSGADHPAPLLLIRGELHPEAGDALAVGPCTVNLLTSASPLEIRAAAIAPRTNPLAVITPCDSATLGVDLVARSVRRRVHPVDRWETVAQLFGATKPSKQLARHPDLADALIEEAGSGHSFAPVTSLTLDLETAVAALARAVLGRPIDSLGKLLVWAETPEAAVAIRHLANREQVIDLLRNYLEAELGPGAAVIVEPSPKFGDRLIGAQQGAGGIGSQGHHHFGLDHLDLAEKKG